MFGTVVRNVSSVMIPWSRGHSNFIESEIFGGRLLTRGKQDAVGLEFEAFT
jgi:hypothetical protein